MKSVALDGTTYISSVKAIVPSDPRGLRRPPLNFDAPAHTLYRTALDRTLKPTRLKRLEKALEAHAEKELAPMLEAGGGDICTVFSAKLYKTAETLLENRRQNPRCPEDEPASSLLLEKDTEGNFLDNNQLM